LVAIITPASAQRRADHERGRNHEVGVDAHQARHLLVLGGGAHGAAELGAVHQGQQARHHHHGQADDDDFLAGDRGAGGADVDRARRQQLRERQRVARPDHHPHGLENDRDADRGDQRASRGALRNGR
jgi:hypothetical protein